MKKPSKPDTLNTTPKPSEKTLRNEHKTAHNARRRLKSLERKIRPVVDSKEEHPRLVALRRAFWG